MQMGMMGQMGQMGPMGQMGQMGQMDMGASGFGQFQGNMGNMMQQNMPQGMMNQNGQTQPLDTSPNPGFGNFPSFNTSKEEPGLLEAGGPIKSNKFGGTSFEPYPKVDSF